MTTPGRNDPCPCGSGKKYKKCCLNSSAVNRPIGQPEAVEPRFYSPARGYYTEGAIVEALKPGGFVRIHPYAIAKLRGDPRFIATAEPDIRARLLRMWRGSKVAAMSTDEIESRLAIMGAIYNRNDFIARMPTTQSAWELGQEFGRGLIALGSADQDFFGLAACELWRRFAPEHPSIEMIDDWVCEGYALVEQRKRLDALQSWWKVWQAIRPRLTSEMREISTAGDALYPRWNPVLRHRSG